MPLASLPWEPSHEKTSQRTNGPVNTNLRYTYTNKLDYYGDIHVFTHCSTLVLDATCRFFFKSVPEKIFERFLTI